MLPKPPEGAVDPKTGAEVFVPKEGVVVLPNADLLSRPNP